MPSSQPAPSKEPTGASPNVSAIADAHRAEVAAGGRFEFGRNWANFLRVLDDDRIAAATTALAEMLDTTSLAGRTFLDIGSGSGLSSLAARRLEATVTSFDFDPHSVACTQELRQRYASDASAWRVEAGSALDAPYLESLGTFDVVYSWGVLHHTGSMWPALDLAAQRVKAGGQLFVAIYNDQGAWSRRWNFIKRTYCSGTAGRLLVQGTVIPYWVLRDLAADIVWLRDPTARYTGYGKNRGMSVTHDWFDWLGGYPFEVAKPEEIFDFYRTRGFALTRLRTAGGSVGCNEFVFRRTG